MQHLGMEGKQQQLSIQQVSNLTCKSGLNHLPAATIKDAPIYSSTQQEIRETKQ